MELKEFLDSKDISVHEFAERLGILPTTIYRWINKKTKITRKNARQVEDATEGKVTAISLRRKHERVD